MLHTAKEQAAVEWNRDTETGRSQADIATYNSFFEVLTGISFFFLCLIWGISSLQTFSLQTARRATSHFDNSLQNANCLVKVLFQTEHLSTTPTVMDGGC